MDLFYDVFSHCGLTLICPSRNIS